MNGSTASGLPPLAVDLKNDKIKQIRKMKERPLILKDYAVRAVLAGLKTQDRRIVKPQPDKYHDGEPYWFVGGYRAWKFRDCNDVLRRGGNDLKCPYGEPGDKLWVRETFTLTQYNLPVYRSDSRDKDGKFWTSVKNDPNGVLWRKSIHMPRWASRIDLEITGIRVERLKEISNEDCWKEGMSDATNPQLKANRKWFSELWESINGPGSWDVNPWVWVVEFMMVKP